MKPPAIPVWFLAPLILLPLAAIALFLLYPKVFTGDQAVITIEAIIPGGRGEVEIRYRGRLSVGTTFREVSRPEYGEYTIRRHTTADRFPGRPEPIEGTTRPDSIIVYSIMNDQGVPATPEETRARILVQSGETYVIRSGKPLHLYRFKTTGDLVTERYLEVVPAEKRPPPLTP